MSATIAPLLLRPDQAAHLLGCSRRRFYVWAEQPDFPKAVILSGCKGQRWFVTDLEKWARARQEKKAS